MRPSLCYITAQERQQSHVYFNVFVAKIGSKESLKRQSKSKQYIPKMQHRKFEKLTNTP